jgi:hypothetical protein
MKKVTQILTALVLGISFVGIGSVAHAQEVKSCDSIVITNTGEGSYNEGVCTVNVDVNVTCTNNVYVLDDNSQEAATGAASELGNTSGGAAVSGNATNDNGQTVQIGASCGQPAVPTTPTTPTTPVVPVATAAPKQQVTVLPFTASNSTAETAVIATIALATVLVTARVAVSVYRRMALK